jgi:demethylmenaquinone methyltransferase/2-methoxy-6-polyprenyl-1,4-benzoquinol methylase
MAILPRDAPSDAPSDAVGAATLESALESAGAPGAEADLDDATTTLDAAAPAASAPAAAADGPVDGRGGTATGLPGTGFSRTGNRVPETQVAATFDEIAPVYDRMNTVMTLGADGRWRDAAVRASGVGEGASIIDVACGTGKLSCMLADCVGPFGRVLGVDLSPAMIELATRRNRDLVQLEFRIANALALPASDGEFDSATIAFGLRNLADYEAGFREMRRVVRPGGTVVCLELSLPRPRAWAVVYHGLFRRAAPLLGGLFRHRAAYRYLPASLDGFPEPRELAATMRRAGLVDVSWRRLALGTVALHRGRVPPAG